MYFHGAIYQNDANSLKIPKIFLFLTFRCSKSPARVSSEIEKIVSQKFRIFAFRSLAKKMFSKFRFFAKKNTKISRKKWKISRKNNAKISRKIANILLKFSGRNGNYVKKTKSSRKIRNFLKQMQESCENSS